MKIKDVKTIEEGYYVGYKDGERNRSADFYNILSEYDLPFSIDDLNELEIIEKLCDLVC